MMTSDARRAKRKKPTKSRRAETAAGRWPVADPEPGVIGIFRTVLNLLSPAPTVTDLERAKMLERVKDIVARWESSEDVDELRNLLGLRGARGRRRTQLAVNREFAMAYAYAEHRRRATPDALDVVALEFAASTREVQRAAENWSPVIRELFAGVAEFVEGGLIDYALLKPTATPRNR
jgi:hypothetical protein